ncbi:efflux RND transporter periplasmic adaptor subunit [Burkholderia sp. FERM BP-3421]|jgi:RND family efflux transporter MFP subunit|uniref:efflux RND transporter periplasmic adaptor subunit n=1 Tax=Burkholderia sp. FERM BP-3421 TaxID=1494466 RepID=UPI002360029C|nr:efflux RND transporter periplasmic adaptor subunit [Burkholderia sp. FERM BP-3421]WDD92422.1 efflux RND transporter periplasmic adaptor subunit [Burkholderia sp. FERM BP-3421]
MMMKKALWRIVLVSVAAMGVAVALWLTAGPHDEKGLAVRRLSVDRGPVEEQVRVTGVVSSRDEVDVAAEVSGRAEAVSVDVGNQVQAGTPLLRIDAAEAIADLRAQEAELRRADAEVASKQSRLSDVRKDWQAGGEALQKVRDAEADLSIEEARRARTRADLSLSRMRAQRYVLKAPLAATVTDRSIHPGEYVQAGKTLLVLTPTKGLQILARVEPADAPLMRADLSAWVSVDAEPDVIAHERVLRIDPAIRDRNGTDYLGVWISLSDQRLALRPQQQVDIRIVVRSRDAVVRVPAEALVTRNGRSVVWVVAGGKLALRPISTGIIGDRYAEVLGGLQPGQFVVVASGTPLREGAPVASTPIGGKP